MGDVREELSRLADSLDLLIGFDVGEKQELEAITDELRALSARAAVPEGDNRVLWGIVANAGRLSGRRVMRWAHVSDATGLGSQSSIALCRRFGFDPDENVGGGEEGDEDAAAQQSASEAAHKPLSERLYRSPAHPDINERLMDRRFIAEPATPQPAAKHTEQCCVCGKRFVVREVEMHDDGTNFQDIGEGAELADGRWVCSADHFEDAAGPAEQPARTGIPQPAGDAVTWTNPAPHASAPREPSRSASYSVGFKLDDSRVRTFVGKPAPSALSPGDALSLHGAAGRSAVVKDCLTTAEALTREWDAEAANLERAGINAPWYDKGAARAFRQCADNLRDNARRLANAQQAEGEWLKADDVHTLTRVIDVALNGDDAAKHPSLCDIASQVFAAARDCGPIMPRLASAQKAAKDGAE